MSEAISQPELQAEQPSAEFQRPGSEEFFEGAVPDPHDVAIEDINPMSGRLFSEDKHWGSLSVFEMKILFTSMRRN